MRTFKHNIHLTNLKSLVQTNCNIADAMNAGNYTMCVYLLKMRELYRWESECDFSESMEKRNLGDWLRQREQLWESLEQSEFEDIQIFDQSFNPFESDKINQQLRKHNLVYSGGLGVMSKPHFFLARLIDTHQHDGYTIYISDNEYARDLTSPPAMSQGNAIYIRRESLKRMMWERLEEWRWNQPQNAMAHALKFYPFDNDVDSALEAMTEHEVNNVLLHEIGEIKAGQLLGPAWEEMLLQLPHSRAELMLRAVRDHLADALTTLPELIRQNHPASIHFYFANLTGMRKYLYPNLIATYSKWQETHDPQLIHSVADKGTQYWLDLAQSALSIFLKDPNTAQKKIVQLIEENIY